MLLQWGWPFGTSAIIVRQTCPGLACSSLEKDEWRVDESYPNQPAVWSSATPDELQTHEERNAYYCLPLAFWRCLSCSTSVKIFNWFSHQWSLSVESFRFSFTWLVCSNWCYWLLRSWGSSFPWSPLFGCPLYTLKLQSVSFAACPLNVGVPQGSVPRSTFSLCSASGSSTGRRGREHIHIEVVP